ncbi:MAG: cytidylate kinase, partial [Bacteroidia bacterium]|nr:cytidylate kinase [Bacteroidia bacterium]
SRNVSLVSSIKEIRTKMVQLQQEMGLREGLVMDGRDIGTVVFPNADLKIFMTADVNRRTERRFLELKERGKEISMEEVRSNLKQRDVIDSTREESPLLQAEDAILLDNTDLDEQQQLEFVMDEVEKLLLAKNS